MKRFPFLTHGALLFTAMVWGGTFVAIKYLLDQLGAVGVVFLRIVPASLCFALVLVLTVAPSPTNNVRTRGIPTFPPAVWKRLVIVAICGGVVNNVALAYGQGYISAAMASLLATSNPIFTAIFSRILIGEPLTRRKLAGIALACSGFLVVLFLGQGDGASFSVDNAIGMLIVIAAPLGWAIYTVISKPLLIEYEPHVVAGVTTIMSMLLLIPVFAIEPAFIAKLPEVSMRGWLAVVAMSVFAIFLCYIIWYRSLRSLEPTQVAVYLYLVPFFGVLWAWLLLGESITIWLLLGGATIISGVIVTNSSRRASSAPVAIPVAAETAPASRN
jgi:drug/metabolite transporter (DMT)-like permease